MRDLSLNSSRRKRPTETSSTSQESGANFLQTAIALIFVVLLAIFLIAPDRVDSVLGRTASAVAGKGAETNKVWGSVVSALTSEDGERSQTAGSSPAPAAAATAASQYTVLKPNEHVSSGNVGRLVLTQGHDILELEPRTTIAVGAEGPEAATTIIRLIDGTIHVKANKRTDGETLSIETQYLVATVKGTKFDVATTQGGAAVSVTEGLVAVRSTAAADGVDVTPGVTAFVSAAEGAVLTVGPTPAGGAPAAVDAASAQPAVIGTEPGASDGSQGNDANGR